MNDEDTDFRKAMIGTKPLDVEQRAESERQKPPPKARFSRADEQRALEESLEADVDEAETFAGEALRYHRSSIGRRTMRRLARGYYAVQGEIDLHGLTVSEARPKLEAFIEDSVRARRRCVRVVHGKGLGSGARGPVLKAAVNRWLRRWDRVLAFVSTRRVDGGTGAVYVLLDDD